MSDYIKLQTDSILRVPFWRYEKDFTFIVNGEEYHTSQILADLLSPTVCKARDNDPTLREFYINTKSEGDFQQILNLFNFKAQEITVNNFNYLCEIFEQLGTENISIKYSSEEITIDNVINLIKKHEHQTIFKDNYSREIDFLSSHFYEIEALKKEELLTISNESLCNIMNNTNLTLSTEDELFSLINELYAEDKTNSNLYEFVEFKNVSTSSLETFIENFDIEYLTIGTWKSISVRLVTEIKNDDKNGGERYKHRKRSTTISHTKQEFEGIISHLKRTSNIKEEINITYSSDSSNGSNSPFNLIEYDDKSKYFVTRNERNSWICIEFKNHLIIPTSYTIRSNSNGGKGYHHLKSWVIEVSTNNREWTTVSEEKDNSVLDEQSAVHTFSIQTRPEQEIKFIRLRQTGPNSANYNHLYFSAIEIYGEMISLDK